MKVQNTLVSGTTTTDGAATATPRDQNVTVMLHAYLSSDGGTATCTVEGRMNGGPWSASPLVSFSLSGASDSASYVLDRDPWYELRGRITAISGASALATVVMGA